MKRMRIGDLVALLQEADQESRISADEVGAMVEDFGEEVTDGERAHKAARSNGGHYRRELQRDR